MNITNLKNDINLFKDETLKALREIEKQLLEKMKLNNIETESKIADFDLKLSKFQEINKRMYESVIEQQVYLEKINHLNDFKSKTETRLISFDVKLTNFLSDLIGIKSRYDKIFLENLTVPGIIGSSCKYRSISDYINDSIKTFDQLKLEKELIKKQIAEIKNKNEVFENKISSSIDNSISVCKLYTDMKIKEIKNFFIEKFENLSEILNITKSKVEENVIKNEEINISIQNEIKNTKEEITNLIEEKNKVNEKIKNEIKKSQNIEFKKEINEMKKNFTELKINMEKQIVNAYKLGKNKLNKISGYSSNTSNISNNNILLKTNNIFEEPKMRNNFNELDYMKFTANENNNNNNFNKNKELFSHNNNTNKNSNKNINIISHLLKNKNEDNKDNKDNKDNIIRQSIKNLNKAESQEKYKIKVSGKNIQLRNIETPNNIIINKNKNEENKKDFFTINTLVNIDNNNKEHQILMPEKPKERNNKADINNKNFSNSSEKIARNKSFSKISNNKLVLVGNVLSDRKKMLSKNNKKFSNEKLKKIFNENSNNNNTNKPKTTKYVIHSIDGVNTISNLKRKITENENIHLNKKKNIAIKLMKNKIKNITNSNNEYLQQQSPTLGLYKEYYDRKIKEEKEKGKLKEKNQIPKKVSPAFGRTAYIKFDKENNEVNLKNYNGNMNIIINDNINKYIDSNSKYFNTINNGELNSTKPVFSKNNKIKKRNNNNEEDPINLSV